MCKFKSYFERSKSETFKQKSPPPNFRLLPLALSPFLPLALSLTRLLAPSSLSYISTTIPKLPVNKLLLSGAAT